MAIMTPDVHMNGDSREELVRINRAVYDKAGELLDALREASPNGRNFYTKGPDAMRQAVSEARFRYAAVTAVKDEAEEILLAIGGDQ